MQTIDMVEGREFMSVREFTKVTGIPRSSAYRLLKDGCLPFVRINKRSVVLPLEAVRTYLAMNSGAEAPLKLKRNEPPRDARHKKESKLCQ